MLLARDRELDALTTLLDDARVGSSGVLALVGEPGIGKSSLLDWTAEHADGMNVLRARGVQSEAHIPFAGLFELLRPALDSLDRLPAPQAAALESALALRPAQAHDRFAVGAATLTLLAAFAETKPLAVLVDDAHWLDGSTGGTLRFALRRLLADPIAVVLTARENEPSFLDGADFATLHLAGLDADAAAELVRRAAPGTTGGAAARLHRDTGGNPLALLELADQHVPDIPLATPTAAVTSVASAYLERAHQLPEQTRSALVVAAASDRGDVSVLERALGKLGLAVADLIPSESAGLLSIGAGHVEFRHPLTRSAIYGDASPEERRAAHRALADALPDTEADRRAWHLALAAAGPDDRASAALEQAGARARDRSAYDVASHALEPRRHGSRVVPGARWRCSTGCNRATMPFASTPTICAARSHSGVALSTPRGRSCSKPQSGPRSRHPPARSSSTPRPEKPPSSPATPTTCVPAARKRRRSPKRSQASRQPFSAESPRAWAACSPARRPAHN
jgi:hypothetical protein